MECLFSVRCFKYTYKYVYKGHDHTTMEFGRCQDEVKLYLNSCYVSSILLHFPMHKEKDTNLTGYFKANEMYPEARDLLYQDFPSKFVWIPKQRKWQPRQQKFALGHMYYAHPNSGECFYLRTLLTSVKEATSFENLHSDINFQNGFIASFPDPCIFIALLG